MVSLRNEGAQVGRLTSCGHADQGLATGLEMRTESSYVWSGCLAAIFGREFRYGNPYEDLTSLFGSSSTKRWQHIFRNVKQMTKIRKLWFFQSSMDDHLTFNQKEPHSWPPPNRPHRSFSRGERIPFQQVCRNHRNSAELINQTCRRRDSWISGFGSSASKRKGQRRGRNRPQRGYDAWGQKGGDFQVFGQLRLRLLRINTWDDSKNYSKPNIAPHFHCSPSWIPCRARSPDRHSEDET